MALTEAIDEMPNALDVARSLLLQITSSRESRKPDASLGDDGPSVFYYATDSIANHLASRGMGLAEGTALIDFLRGNPGQREFKLLRFAGEMYKQLLAETVTDINPTVVDNPEETREQLQHARRNLMRAITRSLSEEQDS